MALDKDTWNKAKAYFEAGKSLTYISDTLDINKSNISRKAKKEQWVKGKYDLLSEYQEKKKTFRIISHETKIDKNIVKEILNDEDWYSNKELQSYLNSMPYYLSCKLEKLSIIEIETLIEVAKDEMYFGIENKKTKGHNKVFEILRKYDISFEEEKSFNELRNKGLLRFDFFISSLNIAIEFNGRQHYEPIDYFGGKTAFTKQTINDKKKRDYCKVNKIKLIEIAYFDIMNIEEIIIKEVLDAKTK